MSIKAVRGLKLPPAVALYHPPNRGSKKSYQSNRLIDLQVEPILELTFTKIIIILIIKTRKFKTSGFTK